jgi:hypothetical protein
VPSFYELRPRTQGSILATICCHSNLLVELYFVTYRVYGVVISAATLLVYTSVRPRGILERVKEMTVANERWILREMNIPLYCGKLSSYITGDRQSQAEYFLLLKAACRTQMQEGVPRRTTVEG